MLKATLRDSLLITGSAAFFLIVGSMLPVWIDFDGGCGNDRAPAGTLWAKLPAIVDMVREWSVSDAGVSGLLWMEFINLEVAVIFLMTGAAVAGIVCWVIRRRC